MMQRYKKMIFYVDLYKIYEIKVANKNKITTFVIQITQSISSIINSLVRWQKI